MAKNPIRLGGKPLVSMRPNSTSATRKWLIAGAVAGAVAAVYAVAVYLVLPREVGWLWQWLLGFGCAVLAALGFSITSWRRETAEELLQRHRRGQHADFGKRLRQDKTARTSFQVPGLGEVSHRTLGSIAVFVLVAGWWLSPWAPVQVKEWIVEDLSVPLSAEIAGAVLVMADAQTAAVQAPVLPPRARELARLIDEDAGPYHRGRKALAEGRFGDARSLLKDVKPGEEVAKDAKPGEEVSSYEIHLALAQNEMYAGQFTDAIPWYDKAREEKPNDPMLLCQAAVAWIQAGKFDRAEPLVSKAVEVFRKATDEEKTADPAWPYVLHVQAVLQVGSAAEYGRADSMCLDAREASKANSDGPSSFQAASLNNQAVLYLLQARFASAQELSRQAREIWTGTLGRSHPHVAASLGNEAMVLLNLGQYAQAEKLVDQAKVVRNEKLPEKHLIRAMGLHAEALVDLALGRYEAAVPAVKQALADSENVLGRVHPNVAAVLATRARLLCLMARYARAEQDYVRIRSIVERVWGPKHPNMAQVLLGLAELHLAQARSGQTEALDRAELACQPALEIVEPALGEKHPLTGTALDTLGRIEIERGRLGRQTRLYLDRALEIRREAFGRKHPAVVQTLANEAVRGADVAGYEKALRMAEKLLGAEHPEVGRMWYVLARLRAGAGQRSEAESCLKQAMRIQEKTLVDYHPDLAATLEAYASMLARTDRNRSVEMSSRARAIRAKHRKVDRTQ